MTFSFATAVTTVDPITAMTVMSSVCYCACGQPAAGQMVIFPDTVAAAHAETRYVPRHPCRRCFERLFGPAMSVEEYERLAASREQLRRRQAAFIPIPGE